MFHSEELNQLTENLFNKCQNFSEHLDKASEDIKNLEKKLNDVSLGVVISVSIGETYELAEVELKKLEEDKFESPTGDIDDVYAEESLSWKRDPNSGKFRLIYGRILGVDDGSSGMLSQYSSERPLIESPVCQRLSAYKKLPKLIKKIDKLF